MLTGPKQYVSENTEYQLELFFNYREDYSIIIIIIIRPCDTCCMGLHLKTEMWICAKNVKMYKSTAVRSLYGLLEYSEKFKLLWWL